MADTITITNLKSIQNLSFEIPPPGVHLLSGANGCGKTSLLACLRRICYTYAFPAHFPASEESDNLDDYSRAKVVYEVSGKRVEYGYRGKRWTPLPKKNSKLLEQFGFPQVIYQGATADRITPSAKDFTPQRIRRAPRFIRDTMNRVFDTRKFNDLYYVNMTRGKNPAFIQKVSGSSPAKYHTEKNLGLGELCVLKLCKFLEDCPNQSLLLIDELELALHPSAQIRFVDLLIEMADSKNLTIIVSTHSATLIKYFGRKRLIFLQPEEHSTKVISKCFPAYALGQLGYGEERAPDVLVYVEDMAAADISTQVIRLVKSEKYDNDLAFAPTVEVVPIGPFQSVINLIRTGGGVLPEQTKLYGLLDADVKEETLAKAEAEGHYEFLRQVQQCERSLRFLPWTPEVAVVEFLARDRANIEADLRELLHFPFLNIPSGPLSKIEGLCGASRRKAAKKALDEVITNLASQAVSLNNDSVKQQIFKLFAKRQFSGACKKNIMNSFASIVA